MPARASTPIAERAGVSKPMIYSYFGDKDGLWAAALREAYVQIRAGETRARSRRQGARGGDPGAGRVHPGSFRREAVVHLDAQHREPARRRDRARHRRCRGDPVAADRGAAAASCGGAWRQARSARASIRSTSTSPSRRSAISRWPTCTPCGRSSESRSTRTGWRGEAPSSGEMIIRYLRPEANSDGLEGKTT